MHLLGNDDKGRNWPNFDDADEEEWNQNKVVSGGNPTSFGTDFDMDKISKAGSPSVISGSIGGDKYMSSNESPNYPQQQ